MKQYTLINNITGWLAFLVALVTYLLTIEPTASFWDCGEFISCAYKLDVGHPPGAPFFMLTGRFFSLFASSPETVAKMLNGMSAFFSALTILFLFWTITRLARKVVVKDENNISLAETIAIMGAGLIGALAYTYSDTFWFSAVEGEVYAYSSLFTAVVFWAILKWEDVADEDHSDKWLLFIVYLMGLSIGVHLLNLLTIPAIVLVYYFKKYDATLKGTLLALLISFVIVGVIMYGFIPGSIEMAGWFELFFVNTLGLSYNTGAVIYVLFVLGILGWAIFESYSGKDEMRMKISFILSIIILGIPFIGDGIILPIIIIAALLYFVLTKKLNQRFVNLVVLSAAVIFIGYSTYAITVIRSLANPPMDQNGPDDMFTLQSYLNREQYGDTPLFYGQYYNAERKMETKGSYQYEASNKGRKIWYQDPNGTKDHYVDGGNRETPVYDGNGCTIFPRMFSNQERHVSGYMNWGEIGDQENPTFGENLRYFFRYQVNFMYWRYFMWNFSGRQNDIQGHGEVHHGNWITGINFIDKYLVGDQTDLPPDLANNKGRNKYYLLPLLLGIIGIAYQLYSGKKGVERFWIVLLLFFMTGLAIVLYLNQPPYQPRERDYAYAGSFYAFAIWIGFGVLGIMKLLEKVLPKTISAILAILFTAGVPVLMATENWDDHDRSGRTTCADFGYNYLESCEPNAVIFTYGDNDTFPLWYMQEVEGVRTDVRVCNLSYLSTDWYIDQMKRGYYDSAPLPIKLEKKNYVNDIRAFGFVNSSRNLIREDLLKHTYEVKSALAFYEDSTKIRRGKNYMPSPNLYIRVNPDQVLKTGTVKPEDADKIVEILPITLGNYYIMKNEYAILDLLNNNNWERPIYYAITVGNEANLGLRRFSLNEGLARRILPVDQRSNNAIDTDKMYDNLMNKFKWGGIDKNPDIYLDVPSQNMYETSRGLFASLASALVAEGKKDKAKEVLDRSLQVIPLKAIPLNESMINYIELYYAAEDDAKAEELAVQLLDKMGKNLNWFLKLDVNKALSAQLDIHSNLRAYDSLVKILGARGFDPQKLEEYTKKQEEFTMKYYKLVQNVN